MGGRGLDRQLGDTSLMCHIRLVHGVVRTRSDQSLVWLVRGPQWVRLRGNAGPKGEERVLWEGHEARDDCGETGMG